MDILLRHRGTVVDVLVESQFLFFWLPIEDQWLVLGLPMVVDQSPA